MDASGPDAVERWAWYSLGVSLGRVIVTTLLPIAFAGFELRVGRRLNSPVLVERIERRAIETLPHVERMLIHIAASHRTPWLVALPLAESTGTVSEHFGAAPFIAIATLDHDTGHITECR